MAVHDRCRRLLAAVALCVVIERANATEPPAPVLETVFPAGGQAGRTVDVKVSGANLQQLQSLRGSIPGMRCELQSPNHLQLTIPAETRPGLYDLWAVSDQGVSAPRAFFVSHRAEQVEVEPDESRQAAGTVPLDVVINGRIEKPGDVDHFRFEARQGQRVIVECWAERIDSRLRAVLELFDATGRRLAVNRGYMGIDPLIDFHVPADGSYVVKVQDLIGAGSVEHYYRLDIDTGPRVLFSLPSVVKRGKNSRVELYGWNLVRPTNRNAQAAIAAGDTRRAGVAIGAATSDTVDAFDRVAVEIPASFAAASWPLPIRGAPAQAEFEGFVYHLPGSHAAVPLGVTDVPVVLDRSDNHAPNSAQAIPYPCEVSGQLVADDERDWFSIQAQRGEVLYIEALGQRNFSAVDLHVSVLDATGDHELAQFSDDVRNIGGNAFPTNHLDPAGRWVVPADGRYLIVVRSLGGGLPTDPRRTYRLSVRREEPDFQLVAVPHRDGPSGLNVGRGGRELLDVLAFRRRGLDGPIRIAAHDLPAGVECPDVWLGPGVDRTSIVISADRNAPNLLGELKLDGFAEVTRASGNPIRQRPAPGTAKPSDGVDRHAVRSGTVVRAGMPNGWGRIASQIPLAVTGDAPLQITADAHVALDHHLYGTLQVRHSPGGIVDVAVRVERRHSDHQAPVKLIGVGLPQLISNETAIIPAGQTHGDLSFYLPPGLATGWYSLVVQAETTVPTPENKTETVVAFSNPVSFEVQPAAFLVETDPFAPTRAKRGEVLQVRYSAQRRNGFIGKLHTELAAPGHVTDVPGLRARGETFVGQTDKGSLQIVVNDDAPLGRYPFLRLFTVGVLEDQPVFFGSSFFALEIVE